jgi:hypothetical protein
MKQNKFFFEHAMHIATACALLALVLFFPAALASSQGLRVFLYIVIVLLFITGGIVMYVAHREKGERANYFLYDRRREVSRSADALSFELVNEGVERYLADYAENVLELWTDIPKKLRIQLDGDEAFRPLIAYRMLLELSEREPAEILACFEEADDRIIAYLCRAIREGGDREMADYIFELKRYIEREGNHIPVFFRKNHRGFQDRMLRYAERHMSDFYMDKRRLSK